jgi:hypothetical protein
LELDVLIDAVCGPVFLFQRERVKQEALTQCREGLIALIKALNDMSRRNRRSYLWQVVIQCEKDVKMLSGVELGSWEWSEEDDGFALPPPGAVVVPSVPPPPPHALPPLPTILPPPPSVDGCQQWYQHSSGF